jgi:hypothetical protein
MQLKGLVSWLALHFTILPLPGKNIQWLSQDYLSLTVAGAAGDFHPFPNYPTMGTLLKKYSIDLILTLENERSNLF